MKKLLLFGALLASMNVLAQNYTVNYESPTSVVKAIFHAANTGDYEILGSLCDPLAKGDRDVKNICQLGFGFNEAQKKEMQENGKTIEDFKKQFKSVFGNGEIIGNTKFETNDYDNYAKVDFNFYPDGVEKRKETMNLVQRGNKWYLSSF
jgi:hypothetical protein